MPRLIVLNGAPGCGKSRIARMYAEDHPLALNLDVDRIRDLIGRWEEQAYEAGLHARAIALAAADVHLLSGRDVVVPQFLGRPEFAEQLEELAELADAEFHEIVLMCAGDRPRDRLAALECRPGAQRIESRDGDPAGTYQAVLSVIGSRR